MRELDDVIRDGLADWADSIPVEAHGPGRARSARPGAAVLATAAAVVVAALGLAAVTSGGGAPGSGPAPAPLGSVPGPTSPLPTTPTQQTPQAPASTTPPPSGPAAEALRAQALPVVTAGYERWEWPSDLDTSPLALVDSRLGALLSDPASVVVAGIADDANLCAWSLQLLDDAEADRSTSEARRRVALHETGSESVPNPFLEAARTEDLTALRQAVEAYRCDQLPLGP